MMTDHFEAERRTGMKEKDTIKTENEDDTGVAENVSRELDPDELSEVAGGWGAVRETGPKPEI